MKRNRSPERTSQSNSTAIEVAGAQRRLNPLAYLRHTLASRHEERAETVKHLEAQVIAKLVRGIVDEGMVSLFDHPKTGERLTEMFSACFTSQEIPNLGVTVFRRYVDSGCDDVPFPSPRVNMTIIEHGPSYLKYRAVSLGHSNKYPEDASFSARYSVDGVDEGQLEPANKTERLKIPNTDKLKFLKEVLRTEVDTAATEERFGAPYIPGGIRPNSYGQPGYEHNKYHVYHGHWIRDIQDQLPALMLVQVGNIDS